MLRRDRVHFTGSSNADIRTSPDSRPVRRFRAPLYDAKYKQFEEKLGKKSPHVRTMSPIDKSKRYYKKNDRQFKLHESIPRPKASLLVNSSDALVGGDTDPYLPSAYKKLDMTLERSSTVAEERTEKDKYYNTKEVEHKKATTETQLVHVLHGKTLEGKVDLKKIVDIRRSIRRRYANRTDMSKIFNAWDLGSLGVIRSEDVYEMVNRLGIQLNMDEAKVLLATANKSMTGNLSLDEFMQLIFEDSDKLNVDLAAIGDTSVHQVPEKFMKTLQELSVNQNTQRLLNSLIFQIKVHLNDINASLIRGDKKKSGLVSFETFCDILNNMNLPHSYSNEKYWRMLFTEMGGTDAGLSYASFTKQLNEIEIKDEARLPSINQRLSSAQEREKTAAVTLRRQESRKQSLLDKRRQPINMLDKMMKTLVPLKAKILKHYASPAQLTEALEKLGEGSGIKAGKLTEFIQSIDPNIFKSEANLFLSAFNYSPQGFTEISEVVRQIFCSEDAGNIELYRHKRVLAPLVKSKTEEGGTLSLSSSVNLLKAIDQKVNWGASSYEAFKKMDLDGDGYVSSDDFITTLKLMNLDVTEGEAAALMKHIDEENPGYLTYQKFAKQMSTPLLDKSKEVWDYRDITVQPSTAFLQSLHSYRSSRDFYETLRSSLKPKEEPLTISTRFGSSPVFKDTFVNFKSEANSPMYITDKERLERKTVVPINIGTIDAAKRTQMHTAKQMRINQIRQSYQDKVNAFEDLQRLKGQRRL
mmetsp:Transcript_32344/g.55993  ORF Transcript_32344/g.55993 Transcript_32344/m.55993 type:complete len:753 (-) Transcript_32344:1174-3432(-)